MPTANLAQLTIGDFELFCRVIDAGGFRQAAKLIDLTQPQVSRRVQHIEACVGGKLLERTTRSLKLTALGKRFLGEARQFSSYSQYLARYSDSKKRAPSVPVLDSEQLAEFAANFGLRERKEELEAIAALCVQSEPRWLSITGPGGTGKTLVQRVLYAQLHAQAPDITTWCDLSLCDNLTQALMRLSANLGVASPLHEQVELHLQSYLRRRPHVLLLDNVDQLDGAAAVFDGLLENCRYLRLIVTTRSALGSRYEVEYRLRPFELPSSDSLSLEHARTYAGFRFFEQALSKRINGLSTSVEASGGSHYLAALRHTGGLPLAIEILAAYCSQLPVERAKQLLVAPSSTSREKKDRRHESLYACFEISWDTLDTYLKDCLLLLSFNAHPFTMFTMAPLAPLVRGYSINQAIALLVQRNLLERETDHYRILPPIRELVIQYAGREQLANVQHRLVSWAVKFANSVTPLILETNAPELVAEVTVVRHWLWRCIVLDQLHPRVSGDEVIKILFLARLGFDKNGDFPENFLEIFVTLLQRRGESCADRRSLAKRWIDVARIASAQNNVETAKLALQQADRYNALSSKDRAILHTAIDIQLSLLAGNSGRAVSLTKQRLVWLLRSPHANKADIDLVNLLMYLALDERWTEILRRVQMSYTVRRLDPCSQSTRFVNAIYKVARYRVFSDVNQDTFFDELLFDPQTANPKSFAAEEIPLAIICYTALYPTRNQPKDLERIAFGLKTVFNPYVPAVIQHYFLVASACVFSGIDTCTDQDLAHRVVWAVNKLQRRSAIPLPPLFQNTLRALCKVNDDVTHETDCLNTIELLEYIKQLIAEGCMNSHTYARRN
ncbi:MAG: LysR family transcriptional regulator [Casimicrobium sp.]